MRSTGPLAALAMFLLPVIATAAEGDAPPTAETPAPVETPAPTATPTPVETPSPVEAPPSRYAPSRVAPLNRLVFSDLNVLRFNPIGLETQMRFGFQRRLFASENPLFRDNFVFVGVLPRLNPAYPRVGPAIEIQPLSILNLRAGVEHVRFVDGFGFLQSFPTPRADYSDSRLEKLDEASEDATYAASGAHAYFEPTFQIKIGNIVVRNKFSVEYWDMDLRGGDTVFYEASLDTLLPDEGMNLANDADLLYATSFGLTAGLRHTFVRPIYESKHFGDGEPAGYIENRHNRLGALFAYTFYDRGYTRFNKPTLVVITSWYLSHRWRTGEDVSGAVPYVVLGFAFQSDLLDY